LGEREVLRSEDGAFERTRGRSQAKTDRGEASSEIDGKTIWLLGTVKQPFRLLVVAEGGVVHSIIVVDIMAPECTVVA